MSSRDRPQGLEREDPTRTKGERSVRRFAIGAVLALGIAAAHARMLPVALVCWVWAFQTARALARSAQNGDAILRVHLQAAFDAAERGDAPVAIHHCRTILGTSRDGRLRRDAVRLLAYAYATSDDWGNLIQLLEKGGARALAEGELEKLQRAASELGRADDAHRIRLLGAAKATSANAAT
jgi:hypothetical protein